MIAATGAGGAHPEVIWNDVECGGYGADLPLWEELAAPLGADDAILELGCGAGRVVRHLAARLPPLVIGVERDPNMVMAVRERCHGLGGDAEIADVRDFELGRRFGLVLAPMQLIQLLASRSERIACLRCTRLSMRPGARAALAIVEELAPTPDSAVPPLADVREVEGWTYASLPSKVEIEGDLIRLHRLRRTVDPGGVVSETANEVDLRTLSAGELEAEAEEAGLLPAGRREVPATDAHVGSTVVLLEAPAADIGEAP